MNRTGIYLVYRDYSDEYEQNYSEEGYYRDVQNALKVFKELVLEHLNIDIEVDLDLLDEEGYKAVASEYGERIVIANINTED